MHSWSPFGSRRRGRWAAGRGGVAPRQGPAGVPPGAAGRGAAAARGFGSRPPKSTGARFRGHCQIVSLAFSGFCPDFGGRRRLLWSSFAAWILSDLGNAKFGQKTTYFVPAAKALAGLPMVHFQFGPEPHMKSNGS